jgi:hypothetical protein
MLITIQPPRTDKIVRAPRPGVAYTQRSTEYARLIQGARR